MLANVAKEKSISLCGITPEQTEADFTPIENNGRSMKPAYVILLTADLAVRGSVTKILVDGNYLGNKGTTILCDALRESKVTKVQELDLSNSSIGLEGAKAVAAMTAVLASLTRLDVEYNSLGEEGRAVLRKTVEVRSGFELKL